MSDLGYWLVMFGLALVVVLATGGVTAYAYFSEDRWGTPRERATQPDHEEATAETPAPEDVAA